MRVTPCREKNSPTPRGPFPGNSHCQMTHDSIHQNAGAFRYEEVRTARKQKPPAVRQKQFTALSFLTAVPELWRVPLRVLTCPGA